jgi:tRNA nucleotidyltransferase (CCA-adding enzyme)
MGDYMFMLESHLSPTQNQALRLVQRTAIDAGLNIYLTGGAMRDILGGFPIRNLDFTLEGKTLKLAKKLTDIAGAVMTDYDQNRHVASLRFPGSVSVRISMARKESYPKAGGPPKVAPATIHEDLLGRDFTVNAIALSLNPASLGLLIDPANGHADLERRELSATYNYSLYDDPIRMLRLIRYQVRLGYEISEKTARQFENARLSNVETMIPPYKLRGEIRHIANDPRSATIMTRLEELGFLKLFGLEDRLSKSVLSNLAKFEKLAELIPPGAPWDCNNLPVFLQAITEGFAPKKKTAFAEGLGLEPEEVKLWQKLPAASAKLEKRLAAIAGSKIDEIFLLLSTAPKEEITYLFVNSKQRLTQDRLRNYLQKYLWVAQDIQEEEILAEAEGGESGSPRYEKAKARLVAKRLRARPKKAIDLLPTDDELDLDEEELAGQASS